MEHNIVNERLGTLRALGREALRGKWKLAVLALFVWYCATAVPTFVLGWFFPDAAEAVGGLYSFLVTGPLALGFAIFALSLFRKQDAKVAQIFYGFEQFGKALGMMVVVGLIVLAWALIIIPGIFIAMLAPFLFPILFVLFIPAIIAMYRYGQVYFILTDNPGAGIMECIARSKELMVGNKKKLFLLELSFIGWALVASIPLIGVVGAQISAAMADDYVMASTPAGDIAMLVASIPLIIVYAYLMATQAGFYEIMVGNLRPGVIVTTAEIIDPAEGGSGESDKPWQIVEKPPAPWQSAESVAEPWQGAVEPESDIGGEDAAAPWENADDPDEHEYPDEHDDPAYDDEDR